MARQRNQGPQMAVGGPVGTDSLFLDPLNLRPTITKALRQSLPVEIVGPPGMGKTSLCAWLLKHLDPHPNTYRNDLLDLGLWSPDSSDLRDSELTSLPDGTILALDEVNSPLLSCREAFLEELGNLRKRRPNLKLLFCSFFSLTKAYAPDEIDRVLPGLKTFRPPFWEPTVTAPLLLRTCGDKTLEEVEKHIKFVGGHPRSVEYILQNKNRGPWSSLAAVVNDSLRRASWPYDTEASRENMLPELEKLLKAYPTPSHVSPSGLKDLWLWTGLIRDSDQEGHYYLTSPCIALGLAFSSSKFAQLQNRITEYVKSLEIPGCQKKNANIVTEFLDHRKRFEQIQI